MRCALVAAVLAASPAHADCAFTFWTGEDYAAGGTRDGGTGLVGWEGGLLPTFHLGEDHCGGVGLGGRIARVPGKWQGALDLRLTLDNGEDHPAFSLRKYLQAGVLIMRGAGLDLQGGLDLPWCGVFVEAYLPAQDRTAIVLGVRLALEGLVYAAKNFWPSDNR